MCFSPYLRFAFVGLRGGLQAPQTNAKPVNALPCLECVVSALKYIYIYICSHAVLPESCVARLDVRSLCTGVPVMSPVAVRMGLFAEDCGGSNGQWLDWPVFSKSPPLKAMAFQLAVNHMLTFDMSEHR